MARQVEETLQRILGEAKGGTMENEGAQEIRLLKERNRVSDRYTGKSMMILTASFRFSQTSGHRWLDTDNYR